MDDRVIERLLGRREAVVSAIGDFKRALLGLARAELPDARFHEDHAQRFDYGGGDLVHRVARGRRTRLAVFSVG